MSNEANDSKCRVVDGYFLGANKLVLLLPLSCFVTHPLAMRKWQKDTQFCVCVAQGGEQDREYTPPCYCCC